MPKAKPDESDDLTGRDRDTEAAEDTDHVDTDADAVELTPVKTKIGESKDTLRQRANWFQKRSGRG